MNLRAMTQDDIERVLIVEKSTFENPWTKNNFLDEFKNSDLSLQYVLEIDGLVIGFIIIWIVMDECHLANIAIHPDFQKRGYAQTLMNEVFQIAKKKNCKKVMLEVRKSNIPAIKLYEKNKFHKVGERKDYYHDGFMNAEDAILMDCDLK